MSRFICFFLLKKTTSSLDIKSFVTLTLPDIQSKTQNHFFYNFTSCSRMDFETSFVSRGTENDFIIFARFGNFLQYIFAHIDDRIC